MRTPWILAAAALLAAAGCSSGPPEYTPAPGTLPPGTAQMTINGQNLGTTGAVQCQTIESLTIIDTGEQDSGVTLLVSNRDALTAKIVRITDFGGFTGSYNVGLGGTAKVTMAGNTYDITGTAEGFDAAKPSFRTSGNFSIKVAC